MDPKDQFHRDGFAVLPSVFSSEEVDAVLASIRAKVEERPLSIPVDVVEHGKRTVLGLISDDELRNGRVKINDLHLEMEEVRGLALDDRILPVLRDLLGFAPALEGSLYFEQGSAQPAHVDTLYLTPITHGHLIAIWVALEDAHEDAGQLEYYPGSHKIEQMRFSTGSIASVPAEMGEWHAYMDRSVAEAALTKTRFSAKKGDVLIWHAHLLHGGSPINDKSKTRKSLVFHYYSEPDVITSGRSLVPSGCGFWIDRAHHTIPPEVVEQINSIKASQAVELV
ncbi:Ectoine hydroxylase-related dioxygenase, phytanoyl-CoA dioxygenase (PhyH) family [Paraburkholderia fungorum]|uniref:Ectoine hydroxylase-related dioxygenase, phytanoyl-CoA dioxygenase (PhyH) family n=1 Tax=Paraburkholderia fungorum TaxID=134537 RepID=A0A1H1IJI6_9BURK|nr:phytanoyl-CoA dioxygenase family protein [Paraburkholderia fungorum]SDR37764.1 Ectoine hydroxylase-related dioxygenase, phytanoyl-CoA dioxygenase (PhyH) family [Paraburkholderia fungorum]